MSYPAEDAGPPAERRLLSETIREVRNDMADRTEVVVDLRDAQRTRLQLLADALQPVFIEVPADIDWFDFVISSGAQPRLWIDAVSHVVLGRDRRTYRFVRDTRLGRVVLAESRDTGPIADQVTRYIAERMVERQRIIEGDVQPLLARAIGAEEDYSGDMPDQLETASPPVTEQGRHPAALALLYILAGGLAGALLVLLLNWNRLPELAERLFG